MSLAVGTRLGPYEIVAPIGAGGMGEVYRAKDTKLNRDVAIKVLPESFALDADRVARFTREAQVLASLHHPNIAAIYGIEEQGSTRALRGRRSPATSLHFGPPPALRPDSLSVQCAGRYHARRIPPGLDDRYAASSVSASLIGTSTPSANLAANTSSPFIASMNFFSVPMYSSLRRSIFDTSA
jgi:Protein kinase domain